MIPVVRQRSGKVPPQNEREESNPERSEGGGYCRKTPNRQTHRTASQTWWDTAFWEACGGGMPFPGPQAPAAQRVDTNPQFFGGLCGLSPLLCHQARRACFEFLILSWRRRPFFSFFLFHIFCPFPFYLTTRFSVRQYGYGAYTLCPALPFGASLTEAARCAIIRTVSIP